LVYRRPNELYPENWWKLRFVIFKYYNYTCQNCGRYAKGELHLHHLIPIKMGGGNGWDNLAPVCRDCHKRIHRKYLEKIGVM